MRNGRRAVGLLLLALLAACDDDDSVVGGPSASESGPVVAHTTGGTDGAAALIEGSLLMSKGCLMVGEFPVIWPHGTYWDSESRAVHLPDGQVVALGDRVSGGGGYPYLSDLETEYAEPLADCPRNEYDEVAMFNAEGQVTVIE